MTRFSLLICSTWLSMLCVFAADPPAVTPGNGVVDGSFLVPYRNAWLLTQTSASGEESLLGKWTDELRFDPEKGSQVMTRVQRFPTPMGYLTLTNKFHRNDLIPLTREIRNDEGGVLQMLEFTGKALQAKVPGQAEAMDIDLGRPVYDWFLYGMLLAGFPLAEGYTAQFPVVGQNLKMAMRRMEVLGRETVEGPANKPYPCWKVRSDDGLTFWISKQAPYILRVHSKRPDGSQRHWALTGATDYANYLELRIYRTKEGQRDPFLEHFEQHYLESQESHHMHIWGQFRDLNNERHFVWLRGFRTMAERQKGLMGFYTSPLWRETGGKVIQMREDTSHVHFLEPVSSSDELAGPVPREPNPSARGILVAQVWLDSGNQKEVLRELRTKIIPGYLKAGGASLGIYASSGEANNFPMLPFIEDESVVVWFGSFPSAGAWSQARQAYEPAVRELEIFVLEPGPRSRLHHGGK